MATTASRAALGGNGGGSGVDIMASSEWPGVPVGDVLLEPGQCRTLWRQILSDTTFTVQQVCCLRGAHVYLWPGHRRRLKCSIARRTLCSASRCLACNALHVGVGRFAFRSEALQSL